ncbi:hypothetical protein AMJ39_01455 [candidate division TA06 bacterium DG_24]|uniref:Uncharacterized protein n=3 Tax=Bacteria division TA06 TaxID=1156500 RepID=A0A0S8JNY7_UNCT6|nr:MAG: hypothetical protein AMJ39_01455 [candidate division TA06 bacterium DG_24]KPK71214.1 MAG: hypothetical protein AMJ82_01445 [candidate division TA06 bacterium SM23_40]KPL11463.1 MAG: hypothetical protein AMJ71_00670 [candidate division TA06 bacterium SM1_40]
MAWNSSIANARWRTTWERSDTVRPFTSRRLREAIHSEPRFRCDILRGRARKLRYPCLAMGEWANR